MQTREKKHITKHVLIVCALEKELHVAKQWYKKNRSENIQAHFFVTGIWNIKTSISLTKKLSQENYDFVINYWVCWYKKSKEDLIQVARSVYSPTHREVLVPIFLEFAPLRSIYCSELPVTQENIMWSELYCDMESYAVEKVCESFQIPRIILKVPVDKIWDETIHFDVQVAIHLLENNLNFWELFEKIFIYLESLEQEDSLEKYLWYYHFTFSEKILLKKYYYKYITLTGEGFDVFFESHKKLSKKEFLTTLSNTLDTMLL